MAIAFACPGCGKKFKVEDGMAGRKGKCPGCDTTFQIPGAAPAPRTEVPAKTAPGRRPVDEDDEAPPPPRGRPESRRPPRHDEEDDRARDEDRPRRRPVEDDERDEEEDDRPRRRRRKKKQKSPVGLILAIVAGAVTLLAVAGVSIWLLTRSGGGSASVADDLKYLPDQSEGFFTFNVEALTGSELYKRLRQETTLLNEADQQTTQDLALAIEDVQRVTIGGSLAAGSFITVFRCKKPVTLNDVLAKSSGKYNQEATFGGHKVRHDTLTVVCVPEPNTVVMGPYVAMTRVLERKGAKAKLSPNLQTAFNELDLSKMMAAAIDMSRSAGGEQPGRGRGGLPVPIPGLQVMPEVVTGTVELGEVATLILSGTCKNAEAAEALKKQLDAILAIIKGPILPPGVPREVMEIAKRVQMSITGNRLVASLTVEVGILIEAAKKAPAGPKK